ncbi:uncharacterized protein [Oryza sativa Japonica Group]|uniref:uncharacterized protein isoform X2 n=1 Tax=Oryza sativa subsp. japonica TaxID=39947 RepID=UPI00339CA6E1
MVVAALDGGAQRRFQHRLEVGDLAASLEPLAEGFGCGCCCWRSQRFEVAAAPQQFLGGLRLGDDASSSTGHWRSLRLASTCRRLRSGRMSRRSGFADDAPWIWASRTSKSSRSFLSPSQAVYISQSHNTIPLNRMMGRHVSCVFVWSGEGML